jgi:hypothetical protein
MLQGNSLFSYLKQTKMLFIHLQKQRRGKQNRSSLEGWYKWERGGHGERL